MLSIALNIFQIVCSVVIIIMMIMLLRNKK